MKKILITLWLIAMLIAPISSGSIARAAICNSKSECDQMLQANQKSVSSQKIQVNDVQSAVNSLNAQISTIQNGINIRTHQIELTAQQINDTQAQIEQKQKELNQKKADFNETAVTYYENGDTSTIEIVASANNLSDVIDKSQYLQSISDQITTQAEQITQTKNTLQSASDDLKKQKDDLDSQKSSLDSQKVTLQSQQQTQQGLLNNAQGALASLKAEQSDIQSRIQQLTVIYSRGGKGSPVGSQLVSSIDGGWYYNQQDYPYDYLGNSGLTIKQVGCLITSIAMIATYYGHSITPPGVVDASNFTSGGGWAGFNRNIGISVSSSQRVNWDTVNNELNQGHPVIASVYVGGPVYNSDGSNHFIVIKGISNGKYLIQDPYWRNSSYNENDVISVKIVNN